MKRMVNMRITMMIDDAQEEEEAYDEDHHLEL